MRLGKFALLLVGLAACASPPKPARGDRLVATIPPGVDVWWCTVSPGGSGAAYAERRGSDAYLHFRDRITGPYS
jgi:hypothetical protein